MVYETDTLTPIICEGEVVYETDTLTPPIIYEGDVVYEINTLKLKFLFKIYLDESPI